MKKLMLSAVSVICAAAICLPLASCKREAHVHDVEDWTITREATCNTPGERTGKCGICLEDVTEEIPVDENNHEYGEWEVSEPTADRAGSAVKNCPYHTSARVLVTLPALNSSEAYVYTSEIVVRPSAGKEGQSIYTYPHELGPITFTISFSAEDITLLSDAVGLATAKESRDLIRSASIVHSALSYDTDSNDNGPTSAEDILNSDATLKEYDEISYELYTDYTYINTGEEVFDVGLTSAGAAYGYKTVLDSEVQTTLSDAEAASYIDGAMIYENHAANLSSYYGTENFLAGLYSAAKLNSNNDFTQNLTYNNDGTYTGEFGFGMLTLFDNGVNGGEFVKANVTFTMDSEFAITSMQYYGIDYINYETQYDSSTGDFLEGSGFRLSADGTAYVSNEKAKRYYEIIEIEQTKRVAGETEKQMSSALDESNFYYTDFDIYFDGEPIIYKSVNGESNTEYDAETNMIQLDAGTAYKRSTSGAGVKFTLTNKTPSSPARDSITFYLRNYTNSQQTRYQDVEINFGTEADVGIVWYLSSDDTIWVTSNLGGEQTIVAKSHNVEKIFVINFSSTAPSALYPYYYTYNNGTYSITESSNSQVTVSQTLYVGQTLYYLAGKPSSDAESASTGFETSVTSPTGVQEDEDYYIVDSIYEDFLDRGPVSEFTAYTAGEYTLKLTSTVNSSVSCTIKVTVEAMPDVFDIVKDGYVYTGTLSNSSDPVTVTITALDPDSSYDGTFNNTTLTAKLFEAQIMVDQGQDKFYSTTITFAIYTDSEGKLYYKAADGSFTDDGDYSEIIYNITNSSITDENLQFTIAFNNAYDLVVTHPLGDSETYGDYTESAVLKLQSENSNIG